MEKKVETYFKIMNNFEYTITPAFDDTPIKVRITKNSLNEIDINHDTPKNNLLFKINKDSKLKYKFTSCIDDADLYYEISIKKTETINNEQFNYLYTLTSKHMGILKNIYNHIVCLILEL